MPDSDGVITFADEYQDLTQETAIYNSSSEWFIDMLLVGVEGYHNDHVTEARDWLNMAYCSGKLNGEAGEIAEEVFKAFRDDHGEITLERREKLLKELGDVMWYTARLSAELGFKLSDVMTANIKKLQDRKERGVLSGSGDER